MILTAEQTRERDLIIFGKEQDWNEVNRMGIMTFEDLPAAQADRLLDLGYIGAKDYHNGSPEYGELIQWAMENTDPVGGLEITFEGYAASPYREDYEAGNTVCITAIVVSWRGMRPTAKLPVACDFANAWRGADEFDMDTQRGRAWWD